jgi:hypothetical protein
MDGQHLLALALLTVLSCRAHGDRLSVALDDAARSVEHALAAFTTSSTPVRIRSYFNPTLAAAAREDCAELLGDSLHLLAGAGVPGAARDDALAWLSAALTSHDTCADGLAEAGLVAPGYDAARLNSVRDTLAMLHYAPTTDGGCVSPNATHPPPKDACGFPRWTPCTDRRLLSSRSPADLIKDDDAAVLVVAQDGTRVQPPADGHLRQGRAVPRGRQGGDQEDQPRVRRRRRRAHRRHRQPERRGQHHHVPDRHLR